MDVLEVLMKARAEVEKGWGKGWAVSPTGDVCMRGAIAVADGRLSRDRECVLPAEYYTPADYALNKALPRPGLARFNDNGTKADVLAAFDRAVNSLVPVGDTAHVHRVV